MYNLFQTDKTLLNGGKKKKNEDKFGMDILCTDYVKSMPNISTISDLIFESVGVWVLF